MEIVNPTVREDLDAGRFLKLNLGCGERPVPGYYGVDCVRLPAVDILADLNEPFCGLPTDSVDEIVARHTVEHVVRFLPLLAELHRVTRPGGRIVLTVPHFSNPYGYSDPTHVRFFGLYSFFYFADTVDQPRRKVPNFYCPERFRVNSIRFNLMKESWAEKAARAFFQPLVNRGVSWMDWYERRICRWLPVNDVRFELTPVKLPTAALARAA